MPDLSVSDLTVVQQSARRSWFHYHMADQKYVDGISFEVESGKCFGLVGEQSSGKLPLSLALLKLVPISSGEVVFDGQELTALSNRKYRPVRKRLQGVFSDSFGQLTQSITLDEAFREILKCWHRRLKREEVHTRIEEVMVHAGLAESARYLYPVELDAVERQMAAVARALLLKPEFLIFHDVTHGLDAVEQAEVLNRIKKIKEDLDLTLLLVTDDLAVASHLSDDIAVFHRGRILECGNAEQVVNRPDHDYTRRLISSIQ